MEKLHNDLKIHYPKFEITKSSNYLYSKDLSCVFHLFIRLDSITIKYPKKDFSEGLINELEDNILEVYKENNIIRNEFDFKKQEDFFYWDIRLSNNVKRTSNLIVALYNMKIPDTISDGIVKKNII